ncbi:metal-dependent protease of the PAD1/JA B1 superfamily [Cenarchaeum symbiosum A]|uniref:Metal-dependent protease of the PAD1/JA B1 superfamily n=1 Tax=Cenarchaeum symbiosum (strain A) TaxID=414004 RepID=A0RX60_CENSY|nr:metal-dependent protease of the PAD1/JA B1 superfamily [Cenarchaeum symbiosum A]
MRLFKGKGEFKRSVSLTKDARDGILTFCKMNHPNEGILVLRGKSRKGNIRIDGLVVPPFSETGPAFAGFPHSFLPLDMSYVGVVHSHPGNSARPSLADLQNFFGLISLIVKYPYEDDDIFAWDSGGREVEISVI